MWRLWYVMHIILAYLSYFFVYSSFSRCQAVSLGERHTTALASRVYTISLLISLKMLVTMQQGGLMRGSSAGGISKFLIGF